MPHGPHNAVGQLEHILAWNIRFKIIGIDPDLTRLHLTEKDNIIFLVKNKLEHLFKEKFRKEIRYSSRLTLYSNMRDDFKEEVI